MQRVQTMCRIARTDMLYRRPSKMGCVRLSARYTRTRMSSILLRLLQHGMASLQTTRHIVRIVEQCGRLDWGCFAGSGVGSMLLYGLPSSRILQSRKDDCIYALYSMRYSPMLTANYTRFSMNVQVADVILRRAEAEGLTVERVPQEAENTP